MQNPQESPSHWPLEFERQQREIIDLWNACNVSLVHRTYFFLLFKGDPADSIYMEVELRRLSFLKNMFSQEKLGKPFADDGLIITTSSWYGIIHFPLFVSFLSLGRCLVVVLSTKKEYKYSEETLKQIVQTNL